MLESTLEQLALLKECEHRPAALDDQTLNRYIVLHTEQRDYHWLYREQFARWQRGKLNASQGRDVNRLIARYKALQATHVEILAFAEKIAPFTIDSLMVMDDFERHHQAIENQAAPSASRPALATSLSRRFWCSSCA